MGFILDLINKRLYDRDNEIDFSFKSWSYDLTTEHFDLDELDISMNLIDEVLFEKKIHNAEYMTEVFEDSSMKTEVYCDEEKSVCKIIAKDLEYALDEFIADKDLKDGWYKGKFTYYYDFSEEEFVCEVEDIYED